MRYTLIGPGLAVVASTKEAVERIKAGAR